MRYKLCNFKTPRPALGILEGLTVNSAGTNTVVYCRDF